jgi:phosphoribosylamine---glycine ligase
VTAGGRVMAVGATAPTISSARDRAYGAVGLISWPGILYRTDIAFEAAAVGNTAGTPAAPPKTAEVTT